MVKLGTKTNTNTQKNLHETSFLLSFAAGIRSKSGKGNFRLAANSAQNQIQNPPAAITTKPP